jgi:chromosome segregation ATPase
MAERVELELNLKGGDKAVKTLGQLEKELDDARQAIKEVEVGSDAFNKLATKIQNASSEVKTLEKQMEGLEPQQKAEAFLKMGEGIAGGFAVAQGALALAGIESEQLEKIQVKVQAAISIAMGVRMMSEAALMATTAKRVVVEKLAIAQSKIGLVVTKASAAATVVAATVFTGAVKLTSVAMKALKLAIAATGIGALVIAIAAIGVAVYKWATATDTVTKAQANLNRELADQNSEFLKNRKLQQEINNANTEAEAELARLNSRLQDNIANLEHNSTRLKENADNLENLSDHSKKSQEIIKNNSKVLERNSQVYQDNIDLIDQKITAIQKEINAEKKKEQDEEKRRQRSSQRRSQRKQQRKQEAEQLRTLEQEIELLRIEDEDKREAAKIEQDRQNALRAIKGAKNFKEQEALINEKFDKQEADRQEQLRAEIQAKKDEEKAEQDAKDKEELQKKLDEENAIKEKAAEELAEKERELAQRVQDFKDSAAEQGFALAKQIGGKNKKVQKGIAIAETAFLTGKSIMRALSDIPAPFGIAQAAIHGAMGAAQIANIRNETIGDVDSTETNTQELIPASTGAFTLGNMQQNAVKAFVVESEITDSQAQMADINRRSTI